MIIMVDAQHRAYVSYCTKAKKKKRNITKIPENTRACGSCRHHFNTTSVTSLTLSDFTVVLFTLLPLEIHDGGVCCMLHLLASKTLKEVYMMVGWKRKNNSSATLLLILVRQENATYITRTYIYRLLLYISYANTTTHDTQQTNHTTQTQTDPYTYTS